MKVRDPKSAGPKPLGRQKLIRLEPTVLRTLTCTLTSSCRFILPFELRTVHFAEHRSNLLLKPEALSSMLWF
jgi:hypothetical protein